MTCKDTEGFYRKECLLKKVRCSSLGFPSLDKPYSLLPGITTNPIWMRGVPLRLKSLAGQAAKQLTRLSFSRMQTNAQNILKYTIQGRVGNGKPISRGLVIATCSFLNNAISLFVVFPLHACQCSWKTYVNEVRCVLDILSLFCPWFVSRRNGSKLPPNTNARLWLPVKTWNSMLWSTVALGESLPT